MADGDTIIALSSGRPPAALAVIRASGSGAFALAGAFARTLPPPRRAALRRFDDPVTGAEIDHGLLILFPAPATATGEDVAEFHLHGSRAVVDAFLAAATAMAGMRLAEAGEFTRRALGNGRIDLIEAEGLAELLAAETEQQRRAAQARAGGAVSALLESWRQRIVDQSALAEIAIDYSDEDDGADPPDFARGASALAHEIEHALDAPRIEALRDGIRVVVAGPANAGKSSLINALARSDRTIVTPIAGTTRDTIEVPLAIDGIPLVLVDTAGLRTTDDPVEALGIERAERALERADVIVWLGDEGDPRVVDDQRLLIIKPKADLLITTDPTAVSSKTGQGMMGLQQAIVDRARRLVPADDQIGFTRREAGLLGGCAKAMLRAGSQADPILASEELRLARSCLDQVTGRAGIENVLDALFARFCVGK